VGLVWLARCMAWKGSGIDYASRHPIWPLDESVSYCPR
jgi:hypothetical protein